MDRRANAWTISLVLACAIPGNAQAQFKTLRFDDDFAAQRSRCADPASGCWKARPLADGRLKLIIGGEARWRHEFARHPEWGQEPQDRHGVFSQRYSLFADLATDFGLRGFAQLRDTEAAGRKGGSSPVDESGLEAQNLFVEWRSRQGRAQPGLRYGIQELRLGSARLVDVREGPNVRRSFKIGRAHV